MLVYKRPQLPFYCRVFFGYLCLFFISIFLYAVALLISNGDYDKAWEMYKESSGRSSSGAAIALACLVAVFIGGPLYIIRSYIAQKK